MAVLRGTQAVGLVYNILHTEVAPGFRKEPTNDFHGALVDV
jgi:hypothetical protein